MRHLLLYLEPGYHIPSYKHIAKLLQKKHEKTMAILKNKLAHDAVAMSLISDIWTSNVMESYCPLQPISSRLAGKSRVVCWQLNHSQSATWDKILQITSSNLPGDNIEQFTRSFDIDTGKSKLLYTTPLLMRSLPVVTCLNLMAGRTLIVPYINSSCQ